MLASGCLVRPSPLLLGQGGDELAAERGDVGDYAAPDRVGVPEKHPHTSPTVASDGLETFRSPDWCAHGCGTRSASAWICLVIT